ncbi:MAG: hypothetical protein ABI323_12640 [Solirubrobacteraceae bacterium]
MVRLGALAAALMVLFAVGLLLAPHSADRLRRDVDGLGAWAPIAMVGIYAVLTCAFVPGSALAGASGLLFGAALGTGLAVVSATLGGSIGDYSSPQALVALGVLAVMTVGGAAASWRARCRSRAGA